MNVLKNYRLIIWVFFVVLSLILLAPNPTPTGYKITDPGNTGLSVGEILFRIDDVPVTPVSLQDEYSGTIKIQTDRGQKFIAVNGSLGLAAEPVGATNLQFGLDIKGGVRAVIQPDDSDNATLEQVTSTLKSRINFFGLREATFRPIYFEDQGFVEISIAGGNVDELRELIERQGKFESKIPFGVVITDDPKLTLDKDYPISIDGETITIDGRRISIGEEFELSKTRFVFNDITNLKINFTAHVFSGNDILTVFTDPRRSAVRLTDDGSYNWFFVIQLSPESAQRFAWVTQNIPSYGSYLESPIEMFLDGEQIDSLAISTTLKGVIETEISITGGAPSLDEAETEKLRLQSILRSGALPTSITIVQLESISPTLGNGFLEGAMIAGLAAIAGVSLVVFLRYRNLKVVVPMLIFSLSEVLIILGITVPFGWTIDIAAIAGVIAVVGTGIDSQIIIVDQAVKGERLLSLTERMKRAFFIVFGAAGTVIVAMLPLLSIVELRGFAIITIFGVLASVLITRPAFGSIIQSLTKD